MKTLEEFRSFYNAELKPAVAGLARLQALATSLGILPGVSGVVLMACCAMQWGGWAALASFSVFVLSILSAILLRRSIARRWRKSFAQHLIRFAAPDVEYAPHCHLTPHVVSHSRLFKYVPTTLKGGNLLRWSVGDAKVMCSNVRITRYWGVGAIPNDEAVVPVPRENIAFNGLVAIMELKDSVEAEVYVLPDVSERYLGRLARKLQAKSPLRRGKLITLEDPEFEKHYATYCRDEIEARRTLTPRRMELLTELRERSKAEVSIAFRYERIYVAINRPLLEWDWKKSTDDFDTARACFDDAQLIFDLPRLLGLGGVEKPHEPVQSEV